MIPQEARHFCSLMVDPAAGVVSVVLYETEMEWETVLLFSKSLKSFAPRKIPKVDSRLIGAAWMGLLPPNLPVIRRWDHSVQRLLINSTFDFESGGLKCNWVTFVFFCLGLGVDLHRGGLKDLWPSSKTSIELTTFFGKTIMKVYPGDSWISYLHSADDSLVFSERLAVASAYIMLIRHNGEDYWVQLGQTDTDQDSDYYAVPISTHDRRDRRGRGRISPLLYNLIDVEEAVDHLGLALT